MEQDNKAVNTIRVLGLDQITAAKSGHPGMVLSAAPVLYALFKDHLVLDSSKPGWFNRDRFVLSAGHGSALLYSTLHCFGFNISMNDLKQFRQTGSRTPGHPELDMSIPIECATGPLGQGISMGVGMALTEKHLSAKFNKPNLNIVDHYTYVLVGDGDLMEGVSYEAIELAGVHKLNKLIVLYDSNEHTIEGRTEIAGLNQTRQRFEAAGFNVIEVIDGNDTVKISKAIAEAKKSKDKPSIVVVNTQIGFGSHVVDNIKSHGTPFTLDETQAVRSNFGLTDKPFTVPADVYKTCKTDISTRSHAARKNWDSLIKTYKTKFKKEYKQLFNNQSVSAEKCITSLKSTSDMATRDAGHLVLNYIAGLPINLIGGSADLAPATKAFLAGEKSFSAVNPTGRNIHFGVREFGMACITNGMILHGGLKAFCSTFFVFACYLRPAMRLAALMKTPSVFIFSHDSLYVGEDGATHQPVEQLESIRIIPGMSLFRPCDLNETAGAYEAAFNSNEGPTSIVLSRQTLPYLKGSAGGTLQGGYVLHKETSQLNIVLVATGGEVGLAVLARTELVKKGYGVRVVSMPNRELFLRQPEKYKAGVLPADCESIMVIEAGTSHGWYPIAGQYGLVVGVDDFGKSGPGKEVYESFGFSVDNIVKQAEALIKKNKSIVKSVV
ncbi:MAG: transketolase [Firmicutes bacterium]|nr:transketolase [Bacillota bacterium]